VSSSHFDNHVELVRYCRTRLATVRDRCKHIFMLYSLAISFYSRRSAVGSLLTTNAHANELIFPISAFARRLSPQQREKFGSKPSDMQRNGTYKPCSRILVVPASFGSPCRECEASMMASKVQSKHQTGQHDYYSAFDAPFGSFSPVE
jgi:hypothetical protein